LKLKFELIFFFQKLAAFCDNSSSLSIPILFTGLFARNMSERSANLSAGTSPEKSFYEGERSSPDLHKAATKSRKKKNSDDDDEDFATEEATSKRKKPAMVSKEYESKHPKKGTRKVPASTAAKKGMTITLEEPSGSKAKAKAPGKKRERKQTAHVIFKPTSMRRDDATDDEEEPAANPPPAKQQKIMADAIKTSTSSKTKKATTTRPKRTTRDVSAKEKNKAPVPEEEIDDEPQVLKKLRPKLPEHDDTHPVAEDMKARRDSGLRQWRLNDPYSIRRKTA
jgi:hypothetical protein